MLCQGLIILQMHWKEMAPGFLKVSAPYFLLDYLFPPQGPLLLRLLLNKIALLALCSDKQFTPL